MYMVATPREVVPSVESATYTVVDGDRYTTVRLRSAAWAKDKPKGTQVIEYLSGPDNTRDFVGFGFIIGDRLIPWARFSSSTYLLGVGRLLLSCPDEQGEFREAYAMRSGRCARCGRKLTVPASLHKGVGPECAKMIGA